MDRAGLGEPVRLQVLRDGVRRGQSDDTVPGRPVRLPHGGKGKTLARAGPALDQLQPAGRDRVLECGALVLAQRAGGECRLLVSGLYALVVRRIRHGRPVCERRALPFAHRACAEPPGRLARLAVMQQQHVLVPQHRRLRVRDVLRRPGIGRPVRPGPEMLGQVAVEIALGEGGVATAGLSTLRIRTGPMCSPGCAAVASTLSAMPCSTK
jgi:hypothetical protein